MNKEIKKPHELVCYLDVSFIVPAERGLAQLQSFIESHKRLLGKNGIEVIISSNDFNEDLFSSLVHRHPLINWVILISERWVEVNALVNQAIQKASKAYVLIITPAVFIQDDVLFRFRSYAEQLDDESCYLVSDRQAELEEEEQLCLLASRFFFQKWNSRSVNLLSFLQSAERKVVEKSGVFIDRSGEVFLATQNHAYSHAGIDPTYTTFYDWKECTFAASRCRQYIRKFPRHYISDNHDFNRTYKVISLIQTFNERKYISDTLRHLENYCDGIILLDDQSSDGTFEAAENPKLLLKVQKQRSEFNDLQNRNILLDLASFFKSQWFYFIDADERFDKRFDDIYALTESAFNSIGFWCVHLWNSEATYRVDIKDSRTSKNGILCRPRMFRNNGRLQITLSNDRKLHFAPIPYGQIDTLANILILHYGAMSVESRLKKYDFYMEEDKHKNQLNYSYRYLLDEAPVLNEISAIKLPPVQSPELF